MSYLNQPFDETNLPVLAAMKSASGYVPNFYRAQGMRPDLIEAESELLKTVLAKEGALGRREKEYLFLVCSGANLSTYCVTAHCEIVRMLGIEGPEPEQIAMDYSATNLPLSLKALLGFAVKLTHSATRIGAADIDALRTFGYSDQQIMEAVIVVGLAKFTNFVSMGLGTIPDFDASKIVFADHAQAAASSMLRF